MNEIIAMLHGSKDKTMLQTEALAVDTELRSYKSTVQTGLYGICVCLRTIHDRELYLTLGYKTLEEYAAAEHGIGQRQTYKYIRAAGQLGDTLPKVAALGITKIDLLAQLSQPERDELLADNTVEELDVKSTEEYKALLDEIKNQREKVEQLEMELEEAQAAADDNSGRIETNEEIAAQDAFERELERGIDVALAVAKKEAEAEKAKAVAAAKKEIASQYKEVAEQAQKEAKTAKAETKAVHDELKKAEAAKAAAEKAKAEAEKAKAAAEQEAAAAAEYKRRAEVAEAEKAAVEKKIKLAADPERARFNVLFGEWQKMNITLNEQLSKLDTETAKKVMPLIQKALKEVYFI